MNFGEKLIQLRKKKGLSQEQLGEQLNVTRQTISKWELGQSKPDTAKLKEIGNLFNVDFNTLIDDEKIMSDDKNKYIDPNEIKPRRWLLVVLIIIALIIVVVLVNKIIMEKKKNEENKNSWGIFDVIKDSPIEEITSSVNKTSFNNTFEFYIGTKYGSSVSRLIDEIITNNKKNADYQLTVVYGEINTSDTETIKDIKQNMSDWDKYEVSIDYDENGYANVITIELVEKYKNTASITGFNALYKGYNGTKIGLQVEQLLDYIVTNNQTNSEHILTVVFGSTTTTDVETIRKLKNKLSDWKEYEVSLSYDEEGYIYQITIEK